MASILVIDDESLLLGLYQKVLTRYGHDVYTASSGDAGIDCFDRFRPDLVITDVVMQGMDGNSVAHHIKTSNAGIPVIGASGTPWKASCDLFDLILGKPFAIKTLMASVNQCLTGLKVDVAVDA